MAVDVASLLGADFEQAVTDIRDMLDFEVKLANVWNWMILCYIFN